MILASDSREIPIEHWLDGSHNGRDNVKFWAGAGGYPGAALARDALAILARLGANAIADAAADPFGFAAPMSSSFRFDWRRDYVPLDAGFSLNEHATMTPVGYPFVELLAAIGLQNARPQRPNPRDKLVYRYAVTNATLPTVFARAVVGGAKLGFPIRTFRMRLDWPGQEGQARCIVEAREEEASND
jgi:CRISPR-associated protein Csx14